ncbi:lambda exonuclease family protein [Terasakiella pusilla]|uniref:lambda exonuclease family protein n=1 Tax=Terasakiella pusilla TaxID=64973 RepID=UPI003AA83209
MKIFDVEQNSDEWDVLRSGIPTASEFSSLLTPKKQELSAQAKPYAWQKAANRFSGRPTESFGGNWATERGHDLEDQARSWYTLITGSTVEQVGFCTTDDETFGCSPDGMVGDDGLLQIKCLMDKAHVGAMDDEDEIKKYFAQVQGEMLVTERKWNDLMFFHPELPPFVRRVEADPEYQARLLVQIKALNADIDRLVAMLQAEAA